MMFIFFIYISGCNTFLIDGPNVLKRSLKKRLIQRHVIILHKFIKIF